jgi:acetyl esterase/lipase
MEIYPIWDGLEKPFYKENNLAEYETIQWGSIRCVYNIVEPTLTLYPVEGAKVGVIAVPGGGYEFEAVWHEGYDVAESLVAAGIAAAVLKYRLPNPQSSDTPQLVPLADVHQALKVFRQKTGLAKVGLVGFSAGSHLSTAACLTPSADPNENPSFAGLIYGVTTTNGTVRNWLESCLYFRQMTGEEVAANNSLERVTPDTPPTFLVHANDDDTCPVEESTLYAEKLRQHHVPVEMHLFPTGGHGFGLGRAQDGTDQWLGLFIHWLGRIAAL